MFAKLSQLFVYSNVVFVSFKILPKTQHNLSQVSHHSVKVGALEVIQGPQTRLPLLRQSLGQGACEAIANTIGGKSLVTPVDDELSLAFAPTGNVVTKLRVPSARTASVFRLAEKLSNFFSLLLLRLVRGKVFVL